MAFLLLRVDSTMKYWWDVGFIGHLSLPLLYAIGYLLVTVLPKGSEKSSEEKSGKSTTITKEKNN